MIHPEAAADVLSQMKGDIDHAKFKARMAKLAVAKTDHTFPEQATLGEQLPPEKIWFEHLNLDTGGRKSTYHSPISPQSGFTGPGT